MPTITHPFVSAIADGGDPTIVRPSNWNADHAINVPDTDVLDETGRVVIPGSDRFTFVGASRLRILDLVQGLRTVLALGSLAVSDSVIQMQYQEARLVDNARLSIAGTGRFELLNLAAALTVLQAFMSANTALSSNNVWTDLTGAALLLSAGVWLVWAKTQVVCVTASGSGSIVGMRITADGVNAIASGGAQGGVVAGSTQKFDISAGPVPLVLSAPATVKLQGIVDTGTTNTVFESALSGGSSGPNSSAIGALRIA